MAKGDVELRFDAQTAKFVSEVLKARDSLDATANKTRDLSDKSNAAFDGMRRGAEKVAGSLGLVTTGIGATVAAVELAKGTVNNALDQIDDRAKGLVLRIQEISGALANIGQGGTSQRILNWVAGLNVVGGKQVNPEEATQLFKSVADAIGDRISVQDKQAAAIAGLMGRAADMDIVGASRVATNFAHLAAFRKPGDGLEGASDAELQDYAAALAAGRPEGLGERDWRFLARSGNKKQALALLLAAERSEENSKTLLTIEGEVDADYGPQDMHDPHKRRLAAIPKDQRLAAIFADPTLAPEGLQGAIANLRRAAAEIGQPGSLAAAAAAAQASTAPDIVLLHTQDDIRAANARTKMGTERGDANYMALVEARRAIFLRNNPQKALVPGALTAAGYVETDEEKAYAEQQLELKNRGLPYDAAALAPYADGDKFGDRLTPAAALSVLRPLLGGPKPRPKAVATPTSRPATVSTPPRPRDAIDTITGVASGFEGLVSGLSETQAIDRGEYWSSVVHLLGQILFETKAQTPLLGNPSPKNNDPALRSDKAGAK